MERTNLSLDGCLGSLTGRGREREGLSELERGCVRERRERGRQSEKKGGGGKAGRVECI